MPPAAASVDGAFATQHAPAERAAPDRVRQQAERVATERLLIDALDTVPDLGLVLNEQRQIVFANRTLLGILGLPAESVWGQRPGEAFGCAEARSLPGGCGTGEACRYCGAVNTILSCQRRGERARSECQLLFQTARGPAAMELEVCAAPLELDGEPFTLLIGKDIGAAKRRAVLERTFFHDALNLAGGIQALATLVGMQDGAAYSAELQRLETIVRVLVEQIRAQRDLSQAELGDLRPSPERITAREMLNQVRGTYEYHPVAAGRFIRCVDAPQELELYIDPVLLGRTLGNLLKNALEASAQGETVRMGYEAGGADEVVFWVHNPAVLPREHQLQLFKRSFSTKPGAGRGIGTFSVKLLTETYLRGRVDFESKPGLGTTFRVHVPRGTPPDAGANQRAASTGPALAGVRMLLAEDDADIRRLLETVLTRAGAHVHAAADGLEAIRLLAELRPSDLDVLLLDLEMPHMSGYECASAARVRGFRQPMIALSAHASVAEGPASAAAGFTAYLSKPVQGRTLVEAVRRLLGQ